MANDSLPPLPPTRAELVAMNATLQGEVRKMSELLADRIDKEEGDRKNASKKNLEDEHHSETNTVMESQRSMLMTLIFLALSNKVMFFGLKNANATYQRLMDKVFKEQVGRIIEVYIDNMVVKASSVEDHQADLHEVF
ncbi:uncharacterized protein LOC130936862 [Arachis stenosperma]|uniref:uncharacterized protein LOC130936862 n=1 Tax=Arachis stenosperma TaxID=217475 RepID=UPI0025ACF963|nr:uncharacterized protein LOC130936862 [Arachis stenosperma]